MRREIFYPVIVLLLVLLSSCGTTSDVEEVEYYNDAASKGSNYLSRTSKGKNVTTSSSKTYRSKNPKTYTISSDGGCYKVGNPYQIFGTWYYPKEDYTYSEVGTASWYGKDFHAKATANGEKYDMNTLTAAHRTLPMPSIVKVTNLENGRSVILRVNDRGPYAKNRIIDISSRGADILDFKKQGTAKVKVEVLAKESKALKEAMLKTPGGDSWVKATNYSTPKSAKEPKVSQKKTTKSSGVQYVQVGSFACPDSAKNLKNEVSQFGKSDIYPVMINGNRYYRVKLGPYKYEAEAKLVMNKVRDYGLYDAKVVKD